MLTRFYKYHGTGNDFVMVDNRSGEVSPQENRIAQICHRHFGIGADGFILLNKSEEYDFEMKYYNSDGNQSTMCGNGGRCLVQFAKDLGIISSFTRFWAIDGEHTAQFSQNEVVLGMTNVDKIKRKGNSFFLDTGSPHHIEFKTSLDELDVNMLGSEIRNGEAYAPMGTNVNFVQVLEHNSIFVRTYERGVENETLSCGTGVVASAIAAYKRENWQSPNIAVKTKGGELKVFFDPTGNGAQEIYLKGPAEKVFSGEIDL